MAVRKRTRGPRHRTLAVRSRYLGIAATVLSASLLSGCSAPRGEGASPTQLTTEATPPLVESGGSDAITTLESNPSVHPVSGASTPRTPEKSPDVALSVLLNAEKTRDHGTSFGLLSTTGLAKYPTLEAWSNRQIDLPQITGFSGLSVRGDLVSVIVEHAPAIDPFVGLQFAREHQIWRARNESGGWLIDPDPQIEPILPPVERVENTVLKWLGAQQSCNANASAQLQAVRNLFGVSIQAAALCGSKGSYVAGDPVTAKTAPETAVLVAQYGAAVLRFVEAVEITGGSEPFTVYLVPIGDEWRVVAVND